MAEARLTRVPINTAAELAEVHRNTIWRALKSGRLSYVLDHRGRKRIDVAELARVYEVVHTRLQHVMQDGAHHEAHQGASRGAIPAPDPEAVGSIVAVLREQLDRAVAEAERNRADADRARDDARSARRDADQWQQKYVEQTERMVRLLTDQRPDREAPTPEAAPARAPRKRTPRKRSPRKRQAPDPDPRGIGEVLAGTMLDWLRQR